MRSIVWAELFWTQEKKKIIIRNCVELTINGLQSGHYIITHGRKKNNSVHRITESEYTTCVVEMEIESKHFYSNSNRECAHDLGFFLFERDG